MHACRLRAIETRLTCISMLLVTAKKNPAQTSYDFTSSQFGKLRQLQKLDPDHSHGPSIENAG